MRSSLKTDKIASHNFRDLRMDKNIHVEKVDLKPEMEQIIMDPHRINFYGISWVIKGKGTAYIDYIPIEIKPNLLIVGAPRQISRYDFPGNSDLEVYILAFNQNLITLMNFEGMPLLFWTI